MYKIAIEGASGTGKTTLATSLADDLGIEVLPEDFVSIIRALSALGRAEAALRHDARTQLIAACDEWLERRRERQAAPPGFVADRTAIDVFMRLLLSRTGIDDDTLMTRFARACVEHARQFDCFVFLPLASHAFAGDRNEEGMKRQASLGNKLLSQSMLIGLAKQLVRVPCVFVPVTCRSVEERRQWVMDALRKRRVNQV
jgi:predicted ATPase